MAVRKKPGARLSEPNLSKADLAVMAKRLRYMDPVNIAKEFTTRRERAAIAAVFKWLSLNATCAWQLKTGAFTDVAVSKTVRRDGPYDAIILRRDGLRYAETVLEIK